MNKIKYTKQKNIKHRFRIDECKKMYIKIFFSICTCIVGFCGNIKYYYSSYINRTYNNIIYWKIIYECILFIYIASKYIRIQKK